MRLIIKFVLCPPDINTQNVNVLNFGYPKFGFKFCFKNCHYPAFGLAAFVPASGQDGFTHPAVHDDQFAANLVFTSEADPAGSV